MRPCRVGEPTLIFRAIIRAAPRCVRRKIEVALADRVTAWIRPRFEVLALCPHWHDYTLDGCKESLVELSDGAFHLELNEAAPLDRILHGKRASDWLNKAVDHHRHRLLFREPAAH